MHGGHGHLHGDHDHDDEAALDTLDDGEVSAGWEIDNVELVTVGIDIGSATSHVMFARLHMQRQGQAYSSRYEVVERRVLSQSPVLFTPFVAGNRIDVEALRAFIDAAYRDAGLEKRDVDTGAVILTGVALERDNAQAIAEIFAEEAGKFVCASAGHTLEAILAAHGSGAVGSSADRGDQVLTIDVGGGTTKFALVEAGEIAATLAVPGGGRLLTWDGDGRASRVERSLSPFAKSAGIDLAEGRVVSGREREALAGVMADHIMAAAFGSGVADALAGDMPPGQRPDRIFLSGGVAQHFGAVPAPSADDLGPYLAAALQARLGQQAGRLEVAAEPIRATVVGASQFSLQVSGNTIHVGGGDPLPIHNVPVVTIRLPDVPPTPTAIAGQIDEAVRRLDLDSHTGPVAVAVHWAGEPAYPSLRAIAEGTALGHQASLRRESALYAVFERDVAASVGSILVEELEIASPLVVVDGLKLAELDFLDIGERIEPAGVVPVVVKSLVFSR
jgi:ethanolamine utilization protein EutA